MSRRALFVAAAFVLCSPAIASAQPAQAPPNDPKSMVPSAPTAYTPPKEIDGEGLEAWIKKLDHKDPVLRARAVHTVPRFGDPAKKAIPKIIDLIGYKDHSVRMAALHVATTNKIDDEKQREAVVRRIMDSMINHEQTVIRLAASQACTRIGFPAAKAIPILAGNTHLRFPYSVELRKSAAEALGMVAQPDPMLKEVVGPNRLAIIALIGALSDESLQVRIEAAQSLLYLGAPSQPEDIAKEKKILLERIVIEPDRVLSMWLRVCLMRMDDTLVTAKNLDPIASGLRSKEHRERLNAADALAIMGPAAKDKAGDLREGLRLAQSEKIDDLEFLAKCLQAIGYMGKEASFLKAEIEPLLNHKNDIIKRYAKTAIDMVDGKSMEKK